MDMYITVHDVWQFKVRNDVLMDSRFQFYIIFLALGAGLSLLSLKSFDCSFLAQLKYMFLDIM